MARPRVNLPLILGHLAPILWQSKTSKYGCPILPTAPTARTNLRNRDFDPSVCSLTTSCRRRHRRFRMSDTGDENKEDSVMLLSAPISREGAGIASKGGGTSRPIPAIGSPSTGEPPQVPLEAVISVTTLKPGANNTNISLYSAVSSSCPLRGAARPAPRVVFETSIFLAS